jgi:hypothetical protein
MSNKHRVRKTYGGHHLRNFKVYGGDCTIDERDRERLSKFFWFQSGGYIVRLTTTGYYVPMAIQVMVGEGSDSYDPNPEAPWNHADPVILAVDSEEGVSHVPGSVASERIVHIMEVAAEGFGDEDGCCNHTEHPTLQMTPPGEINPVDIDVEIAPLVTALWERGIKTTESCQDSHGRGVCFLAFEDPYAGVDFMRRFGKLNRELDVQFDWAANTYYHDDGTMWSCVEFPSEELGDVFARVSDAGK